MQRFLSYDILLDADNNPGTGCTVALSAGFGDFAGAELLLSTRVDTDAAKVTGVTLQQCAGGNWSNPNTIDGGGWAVGLGAGSSGAAVIETLLPLAHLLQLQNNDTVRAAVMAQNDEGGDALLGELMISSTLAPGAITPIPTLSPLLLALLAGMLGLGGAWLARRHHASLMVLGICVLIGASGLAWAATIILDGQVDDWAGLSPALTGAKGDAPVNVDLVALWFTQDATNAYFRIDADLEAANQPPKIEPIGNATITAGDAWQHTAQATDPDGDTLVFSLGAAPAGMSINSSSGLMQWTPQASDEGAHSVTVTVTDPGGLADSTSFELTVVLLPPDPTLTLGPIADRSIPAGQPWVLPLAADSSDPGASVGYALTQSPAGASLDPAPLIKWTPSATQTGPHSFTATASVGALQASASFTVTVTDPLNRAPELTQADAQIGAGSTFARSISATDPDGDAVTLSLPEAPSAATLGNGELTWPTTAADLGEHFFTVQATDPYGATGSARFRVTVVPQAAPVAVDDDYEAQQGTTLTVDAADGVLANDVDPSGGTLTATKLRDPDKGTLSAFSADGSFTYEAPSTLPEPPPFEMEVAWHEGGNENEGVDLDVSIGDLNGDGIPDFVYSVTDVGRSRIRARNGADPSQMLWEHPRNIELPAGLRVGDGTFLQNAELCWVRSQTIDQALIADVDDDGAVEVVFPTVCDMDEPDYLYTETRVLALDGATGEPKWVTQKLMHVDNNGRKLYMPYQTHLSIARLDPDGPPLIFGGKSYYGIGAKDEYGAECIYLNGGVSDGHRNCRHVFALNGQTGALAHEFYDWAPELNDQDGTWVQQGGAANSYRPPLVADLTGDGQPDVLFEGTLWDKSGNVIHQYDGTPEQRGTGTFAAADLTGDDQAELLLLSRLGHLRALHVDGTPLWQTPPLRLCEEGSICSLTVADVTGDGTPDILVHGIDGGRQLTVFDALGRVRWSRRYVESIYDAPTMGDGVLPAIYDLDGDGVPEVVINTNGTLRVLRGDTGDELDSFVQWPEGYGAYGIYEPRVVGLGADGEAHIVAASRNHPDAGGIWAFKSANQPWMKARKRYGAVIDLDGNVAEDGKVAAVPPVPGVDGAANLFGPQRQLETRLDLRERARTSFTYEAQAGGASSNPATVSIDIVPPNRPPVITSIPPRVSNTYESFVYQVAAYDPDPGDTITYSLAVDDMESYVADYLVIDADTGRLTNTGNGPASGVIVIRATDSHGAWTEQSFYLERIVGSSSNFLPMPDLMGMSQMQAMAEIAGSGFNLGSLSEAHSDSVLAGRIMHQSPAGGSDQLKGTAVHLTVSLGAAPRPVPTLVGQALSQADTLLGAFALGNVSHVYNDNTERGRILQQIPAAGLEATPPGPVDVVVSGGTGLELTLSSGFTSADLPIDFSLQALAPDGTPEPLPSGISYSIESLASQAFGPLPTIDGNQIVFDAATRGAFRLLASASDGRVASSDFGVGPGPVDGISPLGEFVELMHTFEDVSGLMQQAADTSDAGDEDGAKDLMRDAIDAWRALDRDALRLSAPVTPETGFLMSPAELQAEGLAPEPQDATIGQILKESIPLIRDWTDALRERHTPMTVLDQKAAAFAAKARQLHGLMPSEYGGVAAAPEYAAIVSHAIPDLMDALMDDLGEGYGLGREDRPFPMLKSSLVELATTQAVNKAVEKANEVIDNAKEYATDIMLQAAWSAAAVAAAHHIKEIYDGRNFEAIVSGASMSFHVFESPWSYLEGIGLERDYPELNTVFILGPDPMLAAVDTYRKIRKAAKFDPTDGQGAYKSVGEIRGDLKQLKADLQDLLESTQDLVDTTERAFQSPVEPAGQCVFSTHPDCAQLMYDDGFASVYHYSPPMGGGGGLTGLPVAIIFMAYNNVTGQLFIDTPVFLPTTVD